MCIDHNNTGLCKYYKVLLNTIFPGICIFFVILYSTTEFVECIMYYFKCIRWRGLQNLKKINLMLEFRCLYLRTTTTRISCRHLQAPPPMPSVPKYCFPIKSCLSVCIQYTSILTNYSLGLPEPKSCAGLNLTVFNQCWWVQCKEKNCDFFIDS